MMMKPIHAVKLTIPLILALSLVLAWLAIAPAGDPDSQALAQEPAPPAEGEFTPPEELPSTPVYRLNSEGDEWILVDPNQVEPEPPAPLVVHQDEAVGDGTELAPVYLPPDDASLGLTLDRAREAGPEAVLAFVAAQPDASHPLLQAAAADATQGLKAGSSPQPDATLAPIAAINSGPCTYDTIQAAVNAAPSGSAIRVAAGSYLGMIDVAAKTLVIEGGYDSTCTTVDPSAITQVNANNVGGSVVDLTSAAVLTLRNLRLTGGTSFGAGVDLLGSSRVTLNNTDVFGNNGASGAGAYIGSGSVMTYTNDSDIYNNISSSTGGGAIVYGKLVGSDTSSDIYSNSAVNGGGIASLSGTVELNNSDVVANTASSLGGGIYAIDALVTLSNSVFVGETAPCCQSAAAGGGIYASGGQVTLLGANTTVMNNTAAGNGGGIYLTNGATLDATGANLGYDSVSSAGNDAVLGAGMFVISSTVNYQGRILNNIATNSGAGLYSDNSTLALNNTTIGGTGSNQHNQIGATGLNGAGMYLIDNSRAFLTDTLIISNTLSNPSTGYGGGIYVRAGSAITLTNSTIQEHNLPSAFDGRGAGMYIYDATVTLSNTQVISNTTKNLGAGARMFGASTLNVLAGSALINNQALGGVGGAVAGTNTSTIKVRDAIIQNNTASSYGGAIYSNGSSLIIDKTYLHHNTAQRGGAIYQEGAGATGVISTTLVYSNTSLEAFGAGIRAVGGAMTIRDSTLANNTGGAGYSPGAVQSYIYNTIIWGNSTAAFGALTEAVCNIDQGGTAGPALDPLFVDPGAADYHLLEASPAVDACASGLATDLDGYPRPTLALWDMGSFEYQPAATATTITSDVPDPSKEGEPFLVSFSVTSALGLPTGSVTVTVSGDPASCSAAIVNGLGSCELTLATIGDYTLTADYGGAARFLASSDSETHSVKSATLWLYLPAVLKLP
jgi:predicted outer membrane repeat protein